MKTWKELKNYLTGLRSKFGLSVDAPIDSTQRGLKQQIAELETANGIPSALIPFESAFLSGVKANAANKPVPTKQARTETKTTQPAPARSVVPSVTSELGAARAESARLASEVERLKAAQQSVAPHGPKILTGEQLTELAVAIGGESLVERITRDSNGNEAQMRHRLEFVLHISNVDLAPFVLSKPSADFGSRPAVFGMNRIEVARLQKKVAPILQAFADGQPTPSAKAPAATVPAGPALTGFARTQAAIRAELKASGLVPDGRLSK